MNYKEIYSSSKEAREDLLMLYLENESLIIKLQDFEKELKHKGYPTKKELLEEFANCSIESNQTGRS
jgi:hypothetical protein|tara:strand:- start:2191 stop:2391 length:201 start_codon:yes stop_codon:yes gene_type:complete